MKLFLKTLFLFCLLCAISCALVACGGNAEGGTTAAPTTTAPITTTAPAPITPEEVGLSSAAIYDMLGEWKNEGLSMHSLLVMKNGKIVAEGYADPFDEDSLHRMYSISKSFVSMAVGLLADTGAISLDDTIGAYFPEYITEETDPRIPATTIRDMLRMASPFKDSAYSFSRNEWAVDFFRETVDKDPGTTFGYDTSATYMLDVIVERVTGLDFLEYLKQNVLLEIGFSEDAWCVDSPDGYAWGGSGVMCTSRDLAAFAALVMNKGEYNGKQLLPRDYCEAATSVQIDTSSYSPKEMYSAGYGYQIWINPHGFAFAGMGNQYAYCIPEKDLVIVCTADNQGVSNADVILYELFEKYIIEPASDTALPQDDEAYAAMQRRLRNLEIPGQEGEVSSPLLDMVAGVTYTAAAEDAQITSFRLELDEDEGRLLYDTPRGEKEIVFGIGYNRLGVLDEPQYSGETFNTPKGEGYRCFASGAWTSDTVFVLRVQVIDDYFGNMRLTFDFTEDGAVLNGKKTAEWFLGEYAMTGVAYIPE